MKKKSDSERFKIPQEYDEVFSWGEDSDVIYLRKGNKGKYINHLGEEILTDFRFFDGIDNSEPYYIYEKQHSPVVIVMELAGRTRDGRTCYAQGEWVRLNRLLKTEVRSILASDNDIIRIPDSEIDHFYSPFTYIYSAYRANSRKKRPMADCIGQLSRMGCFESSWHYNLVFEVGEGTQWEELDFVEIEEFFGGLRKETETLSYSIGLRVNSSLKKNQVELFCLLSFTDRWPLTEEMAFLEALESFDICSVQNAFNAMLAAAEKCDAAPNLIQALKKELSCWEERVFPVKLPDGVEVDSVISFCEFLKCHGSSVETAIFDVCHHLYWQLGIFKKSLSKLQLDGFIALMEWAARNGASPNTIRDGSTGLDLINATLASNTKRNPSYLKQLRAIRDCVKRLGGKSAEEVLQTRKSTLLMAVQHFYETGLSQTPREKKTSGISHADSGSDAVPAPSPD